MCGAMPAPNLLNLKYWYLTLRLFDFLENEIPFSVFTVANLSLNLSLCCDFLFLTTDGPLNYYTDTIFSLLSRTSHCYELCEWSRRS